jgi:hypothetical protein
VDYLAYGLALLVSLVAAVTVLRDPHQPRILLRFFWLNVSVLITILILLKMAGAQYVIASAGRETARAGGWYDERRLPQTVAALSILASSLVFCSLSVWVCKQADYRWPITTIFLLLTFISIRALSLHQVDTLLYTHRLVGVQWNHLIEPTLTLLAAGSGVRFLQGKALFHKAV